MLLNNISIINYRSISDVELSLSPKINCFIGRNGVGKTNLLDAIYYLSFCKSAINPSDSQHIRHEEPFFMLKGAYMSDKGVAEELDATGADTVVTACPLCKKAIVRGSTKPVADLSEIVARNLK